MLREPNSTSEVNYTKYTYNFRNDLRRVCEAQIPRLGFRHLSEVLDMVIMDWVDRNVKASGEKVLASGERIVLIRREEPQRNVRRSFFDMMLKRHPIVEKNEQLFLFENNLDTN